MNKQILLFALNVIKQECDSHIQSCHACPLWDPIDGCRLEVSPNNWVIKEDEQCTEQLLF